MKDFKLPPIKTLETTSFINGWAKLISFIMLNGIYLTIGSEKEVKKIKDVNFKMVFTGRAIDEILNGTIHYKFPFKMVSEYTEEFTREYLNSYMKKSELQKFIYIYFERFVSYGNKREKSFIEKYFYSFENFASIFSSKEKESEVVDQIIKIRDRIAERLRTGILSNQDQFITWQPKDDLFSDSPPCLQRVWIRVYKNHDMEIHLSWRSRDAFSAYMVNLIGLIRMINREIAFPNGCRIIRIIDDCDSAHINSGDFEAAKEVREINLQEVLFNPQFMCREGYADVYA